LIRNDSANLIQWLLANNRKPLVLRGARQVGKTWLVTELAWSQQKQLIEINFEIRPDLQTLFVTNDVDQLWSNLEVFAKQQLKRSECLLFSDE